MANTEAQNAYLRARYATRRDEYAEKSRAYRVANRDVIALRRREAYAAKKVAGVQTYDPERSRDLRFQREYGLTSAEVSQMLLDQEGLCAGCGSAGGFTSHGKNKMHVDHNHATGRIRGILCNSCNMALGLLGDDPDLLVRLAAYLLQHSDVLYAMSELTKES